MGEGRWREEPGNSVSKYREQWGARQGANNEKEQKWEFHDFRRFDSHWSDISPESLQPGQVQCSDQGCPTDVSGGVTVDASGLAVQHGSPWLLVSGEPLQGGWSKLRCPPSVIRGLVRKKRSVSVISILITC